MSRGEFERVPLLICYSHRHELIFFNFNVQNLLFRDATGSQYLAMSWCMSQIDGLHGRLVLMHAQSVRWGCPWNIDCQIVVNLWCSVHLNLLQGSIVGCLSSIHTSSVAFRSWTSDDNCLVSLRKLSLSYCLMSEICLALTILKLLCR